MFITIKSINSHVYDLEGHRLELRGGCVLNEISQAKFKLLLEKYPGVKELIDKGFYIVSDADDKKAQSKAVDETLNNMKSKQDKQMEANKAKTKVNIVER